MNRTQKVDRQLVITGGNCSILLESSKAVFNSIDALCPNEDRTVSTLYGCDAAELRSLPSIIVRMVGKSPHPPTNFDLRYLN